MTKLNMVKPANSFFFIGRGPCPCEQIAAYKHNQTVRSIREGDVRTVTYRHLEARSYENANYVEARNAIVIVTTLTFSALLFCFNMNMRLSKEGETELEGICALIQAGMIFSLLFFPFLLKIPPTICNNRRYKETREGSGDWITERAGAEFFQRIQKISYDRNGVLEVNKIMNELGIPDATTKLPTAVSLSLSR